MKGKKFYQPAVINICYFKSGDLLDVSVGDNTDVVGDPYDVIWWN